MRMSENRYAKELRRRNLAKRMIEYEARTNTIVVWTGLTKYQVITMFREYTELSAHRRHRGLSPFQPSFFSRSMWLECESSALAAIELEMNIIPASITPGVGLPGLARGERLLYAFDLYRSLIPNTRMTLEHAVLLAQELTAARTLALGRCVRCDGLMVRDRLGAWHHDCAFCRLGERVVPETDSVPA